MSKANPSIAEQVSPLGFEVTLERLTEAIERAGLTIFARIGQAVLDLPLRALVREDADGRTLVAFHPIAPMLLDAGVPDALANRL